MSAVDWALQEAMEEVDALTPSCPKIAPPRAPIRMAAAMARADLMLKGVPRDVLELHRFVEVDCKDDQLRDFVTRMKAGAYSR